MSENITELENVYVIPMNLPVEDLFGQRSHLLFELCKRQPTADIRFVDETRVSFGKGAARKFLRDRFYELIKDGYLITRGIFVFLNPASDFWKELLNVKHLCYLIAATKANDGFLPYHLSPVILSHINSDFDMLEDSAEFFLEKIDKQVFDSMKRDSDLDRTMEELGYTKLEYIREIIDPYERRNLELYDAVGRWLEIIFFYDRELDLCSVSDVLNITCFSSYLSGYYIMNSETVWRKITVNHPDSSKQESVTIMLRDFVLSLDEDELVRLLISWTSNTSVLSQIRVSVTDSQVEDVRIQTCFCTVSISSRFFVDAETLRRLKLTFVEGDQMTD